LQLLQYTQNAWSIWGSEKTLQLILLLTPADEIVPSKSPIKPGSVPRGFLGLECYWWWIKGMD
jgi:hypothetical protein